MSARDLLFTFDHELFLGRRSGTPENCLLRPGDAVMDVLERYGSKAVFFVDTTYLMRMEAMAGRHAAIARDLGLIHAQLQDMLRRGHAVYPHIHPHWLDATYDEGSNMWHLEDLSKYRFADLSSEARTQVFDGSIELLRRVLSPVDPNYSVDTYRAGGWCIQPFSDFEPFFRKHSIRYDLSVLAGAWRSTNALRYDFTATPAQLVYRFANDVMVPASDGPYTELAISMVDLPKAGFVDDLLGKVLWRIPHGRQMGDGQGVQFVDDDGGMIGNGADRAMMSIELLNVVRLPAFVRHVEKHPFTQFISHPKMLSPHNLSMLNKLLRKLAERFDLRSDWKAYAARVAG